MWRKLERLSERLLNRLYYELIISHRILTGLYYKHARTQVSIVFHNSPNKVCFAVFYHPIHVLLANILSTMF